MGRKVAGIKCYAEMLCDFATFGTRDFLFSDFWILRDIKSPPLLVQQNQVHAIFSTRDFPISNAKNPLDFHKSRKIWGNLHEIKEFVKSRVQDSRH